MLYLLPNKLVAEAKAEETFVPKIEEIIYSLDGFFVEHDKEARKFLKCFDFAKLRDKPMVVLDKRTKEFGEHIELLKKGSWGVITNSGLPCLADPGALLVKEAKKHQIEVITFPGPCSILLALQLSGLYSQKFTFHGYLPRDFKLPKESGLHIFIEAPYNNQRSLNKLLQILEAKDTLCIACDLTLPSQEVITQTVQKWRQKNYDFHKRPAIFIIDR